MIKSVFIHSVQGITEKVNKNTWIDFAMRRLWISLREQFRLGDSKRKTLPKRFGLLFKRGILFFERKYLFGGLCGVAFLFKRVWRLCRPALP
ncbi:hypothetical protein [Bilophila wadsworthia]|uniref:hypothetical protein n=1 Tax=Bilophila wadsworthia TaxID=35833 RepID=UPI00399D26AE